jgi:hypothetical protein
MWVLLRRRTRSFTLLGQLLLSQSVPQLQRRSNYEISQRWKSRNLKVIDWLRFKVLTAASMKMTLFWDVASCRNWPTFRRSLLSNHQSSESSGGQPSLYPSPWEPYLVNLYMEATLCCVRGHEAIRIKPSDYVLNHRPDDGGSKDLWNISNILPDCKAQHPIRQSDWHF